MNAAEIRTKFLEYFERQGHLRLPSSPVIPSDDPTLLFTNAGMVQFKRVFLGQEKPRAPRATTAQKCLRAGGKHNDLEQVGHTARHLTFFEMLGNFSFGDYFKRDAIRFAWEFVTTELKIDRKHLRVSVFEEDDEARKLWKEIAGLPDSRIYGLGAHDNFWQMADTGPCGPCTEIFVDMAHLANEWKFPPGAKGEWTELGRDEFSKEAFVAGSEADRFIEIWNLVFMQFDRQEDGTLVPLPKPSVDTGAGLDRITAVMQGQGSTFHSDLFKPLIATVESATQLKYDPRATGPSWQMPQPFGHRVHDVSPMFKKDRGVFADPASFRVIADHARAVAFLLADGVFPSNEGRGYVLRRILRRAVRHAWLLGRNAPTLDQVVAKVVETMGDAYPELKQRGKHIEETTRAEEVRFLATIEGGMKRFEELAPEATTQGSTAVRGTISGEDAFKLYDTFGFPIDLTELMARERGYTVDIAGFEKSLEGQRSQSKAERKSKDIGMSETATLAKKADKFDRTNTEFTGYTTLESSARVLGIAEYADDRIEIIIDKSPFYVQSGGQISDVGELVAPGWRFDVTGARNLDGKTYLSGKLNGARDAVIASVDGKDQVTARVPRDRRLDTERNHTATHLLHAALREVLGDHVHQAGSLVAPDRLRFDFTHHGPVTAEQQSRIEELVNEAILDAIPLRTDEKPYKDAVAGGAMALFGEKYGDVVRVVSIPGVSQELCGGTHVRNTSEIALFKITAETGVAAGVRRIEAVTGRAAVDLARQRDAELKQIEGALKVPNGALRRIHALADERRALEKRLDDARKSGGGNRAKEIVAGASSLDGMRLITAKVEAADLADLQSLGDEIRGELKSGVAFLFSSFENGKNAMLAVVTDDLRERGMRADEMIREVAAAAGGKGGGKPHMAQAGIPDETKVAEAFALAPEVVKRRLASAK